MPHGVYWTDEETKELLEMIDHMSAGQIAKQIKRTRSAVCGKINRLRGKGKVAKTLVKHYDIDPVKHRKPRILKAPPRRTMKPKPPVSDELAMRPCRILDLDHTNCHWPLGALRDPVEFFCGGPVDESEVYCPHHKKIATRTGATQ